MGVCRGDLYGSFSPVFSWQEGRDCVGVVLRENTLGSWTWLFILQADLDCMCNPNNSSNAQQHRESQGLFNSDLQKS